jgi:hypothetical protein
VRPLLLLAPCSLLTSAFLALQPYPRTPLLLVSPLTSLLTCRGRPL